MRHNLQGNWFLEWHFDVLILWALANANELSKAEDLLKGLRSRLEGSFCTLFSLKCAIAFCKMKFLICEDFLR